MNSQVSSTRYNCFRFSFLAQTVLTITTSSTSSAAVYHFSPYGTILLFHHLFLRNEKKRLEKHQCLLSLRHVIVITIINVSCSIVLYLNVGLRSNRAGLARCNWQK